MKLLAKMPKPCNAFISLILGSTCSQLACCFGRKLKQDNLILLVVRMLLPILEPRASFEV